MNSELIFTYTNTHTEIDTSTDTEIYSFQIFLEANFYECQMNYSLEASEFMYTCLTLENNSKATEAN